MYTVYTYVSKNTVQYMQISAGTKTQGHKGSHEQKLSI